MVLRFFISVKDPFVESWLGIYGNTEFNRLLYLYELDPITNRIEFLGVDKDTPLNRRKYMSYGFRDLSEKLNKILEIKPTEIDLFTFNITELIYRNPELAKKISKFIRK
ncbi:MAG: hypothetical protein ACP5GJ_02550 [Nanopusillaceae archaeon]